jgi:hypothetical protein
MLSRSVRSSAGTDAEPIAISFVEAGLVSHAKHFEDESASRCGTKSKFTVKSRDTREYIRSSGAEKRH